VNLAGLYSQIEAKKRRISKIMVEIVPKRAERLVARAPTPAKSIHQGDEVPSNPFAKQREAEPTVRYRLHHELESRLAANVQIEPVHEQKHVGRRAMETSSSYSLASTSGAILTVRGMGGFLPNSSRAVWQAQEKSRR